MNDVSSWRIVGEWFDNCSCAVACPCTFAQPPDNGYCESVLFWHVERGHYGDVDLGGLSFVRVGRWEGDLWAGKVKGGGGAFIAYVFVLTLLLIAVCWVKGEPPRWRWGGRNG